MHALRESGRGGFRIGIRWRSLNESEIGRARIEDLTRVEMAVPTPALETLRVARVAHGLLRPAMTQRQRSCEGIEFILVELHGQVLGIRHGIVELIGNRALGILRIPTTERDRSLVVDIEGPLREDSPAAVVRNVVVAVFLRARCRVVELDVHDIFYLLVEVVEADNAVQRVRGEQELELLTELVAIAVIVRVQDRQRRVIGIANAFPLQRTHRGDRFEQPGVVHRVADVKRRTPVL